MVNILDSQQLQNTLGKLKTDALPVFGKMSPQHILEHLAKSLKASSGKLEVKSHLTSEEADKLKQKLIYSDFQLTPGIKSPIMGDEPPALIHPDFNEALKHLYEEINYFENYYKTNSEVKHIHPRMGELTYSEWLVFHNKHFAHHFRQYNLV